MGTGPVLVTYASKHGSTAEIATEIRDRLREHGVDAVVLPVGEVRDLAEHRAVVLGSAVYAGRWRGEAVRFLRRNRRALAERDVWLFQSGPLNDSADRAVVPLPKNVAGLAEQIGVRGHTTFGGKLDADARGFVARKMVQNGLAGDFCNFERVRAWACEIAGALSSHTA
jgi:menaquinone-dependent protoporphyrinogen oxidase